MNFAKLLDSPTYHCTQLDECYCGMYMLIEWLGKRVFSRGMISPNATSTQRKLKHCTFQMCGGRKSHFNWKERDSFKGGICSVPINTQEVACGERQMKAQKEGAQLRAQLVEVVGGR